MKESKSYTTHWLASSRITFTPSTTHSSFMGRIWIYCSSTCRLLFTKLPVIYQDRSVNPATPDKSLLRNSSLLRWIMRKKEGTMKNGATDHKSSIDFRLLSFQQLHLVLTEALRNTVAVRILLNKHTDSFFNQSAFIYPLTNMLTLLQ